MAQHSRRSPGRHFSTRTPRANRLDFLLGFTITFGLLALVILLKLVLS